MNETTYNGQAMTEYLLGTLPAAEVERFDQLSVDDAEFAAVLSACEKDLVDDYVRGELADPALSQFKSHYLVTPLRRQRVAFAQTFRVFAEREASEVQAKGANRSATKGGWFTALRSLLATQPALQWGLAAGLVVLLVAGAWFAVQNLRLRQQVSETQIKRDELRHREQALQKELEAQHAANLKAEAELAQVRAERERLDRESRKQNGPAAPDQAIIASFILSPGLRGAGQIQTVSIPPGSGSVACQLNLEPNEFVAYRVALIDQSNHQTLWQSGRLRAHSASSIGVSFASRLLKSQTYILQVSGIAANGQLERMSDYPFKVVK